MTKNKKNPAYFSGGTEIITLGRTNRLTMDAIIDIKSIPECLVTEINHDEIQLGAALSLTKVIETNYFPLLNEVSAQIADQTARNKITLGGNICGNIPYREAALPFLLTKSKAIIASNSGIKEHSFNSFFNQRPTLENEELLVAIKIQKSETEIPFVSIKKRRQWDVGYPLISAAAVNKNHQLKIAFSGLCNFPFHLAEIDGYLNNENLTEELKIEKIKNAIPAPILNDVHGSSAYRQFVLKNIIQEIYNTFKGGIPS